MDAPDSPAAASGGTPRKSLWRSASWCARSSPTSAPSTSTTTAAATTTSPARPRPAPLHLPPLSISRCPRAWPPPAPADASSTSSPAASSLVDGDLSRVAATDHIYLGGDAAARDRALLRRHGITHVLNCAGFACLERFPGELRYRTLWLRDHPGEDIASLLYAAFDFLEEARAHPRGRALVHCSRGTSRSAAVVVGYLMWRRAVSFDDALRLVRAARPAADPNPGFASQLLHWQRRVLGLPLPPSPQDASPRVYRLAPHSPYDPLHLVPKAVERPGAAELDSRGAFLVHAPAAGRGAVYVWVGDECDPAMAASADAVARQVLRYERARGSVMAVSEGYEPVEFWDALGCCEIERGKKRVESFDLDFEIYRRALKGGPKTAPVPSPTPSPEAGPATPRTTENPNSGDHIDAAAPFGSPTSSDGYSTLFSVSPASSSSDWYNSSPGSDLSYGEPLSLRSPRPPRSPCAPSLAERRGGAAPSLRLQAHVGEIENTGDAAKEWPFSPYPLGREEEDEGLMDVDQTTPSDLGQTVEVEGAALYHWQPCLQKVEMLHPGVLDSNSVFILLAPKRRSSNGGTKILFVWVGRDYHLGHGVDGHGGGMEDEARQACFKRIGLDFLNQMSLPVDIPVQVIRQEEEPEEFLNHLFTFHQIKESGKK